MAQQSRPDPLDIMSKDEIEMAWDYFTHLPSDHPNRIDVITLTAAPAAYKSWNKRVTIRYCFQGQEKEIRQEAARVEGAKFIAITNILRETRLDISEVPIRSDLPQW